MTTNIVKEAVSLGIRHIWLQPGSESEDAIRIANDAGIEIISHGPCVLVAGAACIQKAARN